MKEQRRTQPQKGEKYEKIVQNALTLAGYATYTRPKVKYHSGDMFRGDVLFVYQGRVVVLQTKRYTSEKAGLAAGRKALRDTMTDKRAPRHYLVIARTDTTFSVLYNDDEPQNGIVAKMLCRLFGGGNAVSYTLDSDGALKQMTDIIVKS